MTRSGKERSHPSPISVTARARLSRGESTQLANDARKILDLAHAAKDPVAEANESERGTGQISKNSMSTRGWNIRKLNIEIPNSTLPPTPR